MLVQVRFECKAFAAALARVVLEGRVCLHVGSQVGAVGEGLAAVSAGERFLAGVRSHVALQQPGSAEGLTAQRALVLQVVSQHVHGERWHRHVRLVTAGALPGLLTVHAAVRLLVSAQIGRCSIGLPTL